VVTFLCNVHIHSLCCKLKYYEAVKRNWSLEEQENSSGAVPAVGGSYVTLTTSQV
jgi:hypothetical protein